MIRLHIHRPPGHRWTVNATRIGATLTQQFDTSAEAWRHADELLRECVEGFGPPVGGAARHGPGGVRERRE